MTRPVRAVPTDARTTRPGAPSLRRRIRRAFPLADGVTYAIAAGALITVWLVAELLGSLASHLPGAP